MTRLTRADRAAGVTYRTTSPSWAACRRRARRRALTFRLVPWVIVMALAGYYYLWLQGSGR